MTTRRQCCQMMRKRTTGELSDARIDVSSPYDPHTTITLFLALSVSSENQVIFVFRLAEVVKQDATDFSVPSKAAVGAFYAPFVF